MKTKRNTITVETNTTHFFSLSESSLLRNGSRLKFYLPRRVSHFLSKIKVMLSAYQPTVLITTIISFRIYAQFDTLN